jgi:hypothetical protein
MVIQTKSSDKLHDNPNHAENPSAKNRPSEWSANEQDQSNVSGNKTKNSEKEPAKKSGTGLIDFSRVSHKRANDA